MSDYGPYTGDSEKSCSYKWGDHWKDKKGYKLVEGTSKHNHYFGGESWHVPVCKNCGGRYHQILTLDMTDERLDTGYKGSELPLVSCLNCSLMWETQVFKIDDGKKEIHVIEDKNCHGWVQDEEYKIPVPLPRKQMKLVALAEEENPLAKDLYYSAFDALGYNHLARVLGAPLYAQSPVDYECPLCHGRMQYIASVSAMYGNTIFQSYDFDIGECFLYFLLCADCSVVKVEMQGD